MQLMLFHAVWNRKRREASVGGNLAVPLKIADLFYNKNGVPTRKIKPGTMMIA